MLDLDNLEDLENIILDNPYSQYMHETGTNKSNGFWYGPYNIKVHNHIPYVPAEDGVNQVAPFNIPQTKIKTTLFLSEKEYVNTFCYLGNDGFYWFNHYKYHQDKKYTCIGHDKKIHIYNINELYNNTNQKQVHDCTCIIL